MEKNKLQLQRIYTHLRSYRENLITECKILHTKRDGPEHTFLIFLNSTNAIFWVKIQCELYLYASPYPKWCYHSHCTGLSLSHFLIGSPSRDTEGQDCRQAGPASAPSSSSTTHVMCAECCYMYFPRYFKYMFLWLLALIIDPWEVN